MDSFTTLTAASENLACGDFYKKQIGDYPYRGFYKVEDDRVVVVAIHHARTESEQIFEYVQDWS